MLKKIMDIIIPFTIIIIFSIGCGKQKHSRPIKSNQMNVSILLDLSDRIEPSKHPYQKGRDISIIKNILESLRNDVIKKGTFKSLDRVNLFFYPQPRNSSMADIADVLNFDLSKMSPREKKELFKNLDKNYIENLNLLYDLAMKKKDFHGSDIWRFFKDEVADKCIINNPKYKNILIILTDGYVYWKNTKQKINNRYTYILPSSRQIKMFRNDKNWEKKFEDLDFGLVKINQDLNKLYVLVAEINPTSNYPQDYDIIKKYLSKWFNEMNIRDNHFKILKTDLPVYTKPIIDNFLSK